jgi:hypothetical protein
MKARRARGSLQRALGEARIISDGPKEMGYKRPKPWKSPKAKAPKAPARRFGGQRPI